MYGQAVHDMPNHAQQSLQHSVHRMSAGLQRRHKLTTECGKPRTAEAAQYTAGRVRRDVAAEGFGRHHLQDEGSAGADVGAARQEIAAHQCLQDAALAAGLAADDRDLRQLQLKVQRDLRAVEQVIACSSQAPAEPAEQLLALFQPPEVDVCRRQLRLDHQGPRQQPVEKYC